MEKKVKKQKKHEQEFGIDIQKSDTIIETGVKNLNKNFKAGYGKDQVNWEMLKQNTGISENTLEDKGMIEAFLAGKKTGLLPINVIDADGNIIGETQAKLALYKKDDKILFRVYAVKEKPELDKPYFGHTFTEEEKNNLLKTGNTGSVILADFDNSGNKIPILLSLDKETNHFAAVRQSSVYIGNDFFGANITDEQKELLKKGEPVKLSGIKRTNGTEYTGTVQYNAEKKSLGIVSNGIKQEVPHVLCGIELSEQQKETLTNSFDKDSGKVVNSIYLENMHTKDGNTFSSFVYKNEEGKIKFSSNDPTGTKLEKQTATETTIQSQVTTKDDKMYQNTEKIEDLAGKKTIFLNGLTDKNGGKSNAMVQLKDNFEIQVSKIKPSQKKENTIKISKLNI